ncbi:potassium channel protein [Francisella noatunensis subsp. orientalis]|nr:ion channel [Francisella orientalis]APD42014.1 potassium channel protein [Francisella orientalis]NIB60984.1 potassium channel protein [Francisella orientalis]NIB62502.1 potassium channel protein [Francisella orientalis]NIB66014.1 potassium channel protein [Francisella orientalis]NIY51135.1 potassium channel protein [Francisella orientalis]
MTLNGFITILAVAAPVINKIFSVNLDANIPSDLYDFGMKYNTRLGIFLPLILGYLMIIIARGIYNRKRTFWFLAVIFISLSIIGDYVQDKHISYDVAFFTHVLEILLLIYFRKTFDKKNSNRITFYQFVLLISFFLAIGYSVTGLYYLKDEFDGIKNISDALYFTIVTFSTVGYGDIHPLTEEAKLFTVSIMIMGIGLFATIITVMAGSVINRITEKFKQKDGAALMKDHIVICGYTEITKCLIKDYFKSHIDNIIVIEKNYYQKFINTDVEQEKHFIDAESYDYDALKKASITKAKSIFILNEKDSDNILTLLSIKEVLKTSEQPTDNIKISIKLDKDESINIANNIGVDQIVSPTKKIAEMLIKYE